MAIFAGESHGGEMTPQYVLSDGLTGTFARGLPAITFVPSSDFDTPGGIFGVTAREFMSQVSPNLDLSERGGINVQYYPAGDYAIGSLSAGPDAIHSYMQPSRVDLFVKKGNEFRSNLTSPSLDVPPLGLGNFAWTLNEKGQFLYGYSVHNGYYAENKTGIYDWATDTRTLLPSDIDGTPAWASASWINNQGAVVGQLQYDSRNTWDGGYVRQAFLYRDGVMSDLNDLVKLSEGQILYSASGLTDTGDIAAEMYDSVTGKWSFVTLAPATVPEPSSWIIGIAGIAAAAWKIRKKRETTTG
jgi:probable HAF family extracellular repeat protein